MLPEFDTLVTGALEAALRTALRLDPDAPARLPVLRGKICALELTDLNKTLFFLFHDNGIDVLSHYEANADAKISGTVSALAKLALNAQKPGGVLGSGVQFAGDLGTAQAFQSFFQSLHIDWEEQLALRSNDVIARQLSNSARGLFNFAKRTLETARLNTGEYIREEARASPGREEVEYFADRVDELQNDVARLEARIKRLKA